VNISQLLCATCYKIWDLEGLQSAEVTFEAVLELWRRGRVSGEWE